MESENLSLNQREKASNKHIAKYTFAWLVTLASLAFGPKFLWDGDLLFSILAALLNLLAGAGMVYANVKMLRQVDELSRKVFLDAAAITLGVVMVFGVCYELLSMPGILNFKAQISHVYFVMGPTFLLAMFWGNRRYR